MPNATRPGASRWSPNEACAEAYASCGYQLIELARMAVEARAHAVMEIVEASTIRLKVDAANRLSDSRRMQLNRGGE